MSLIFDSFPSLERAVAFAGRVMERYRYRLGAQVFMDARMAHDHDPFPWVQVPPVVHVDRNWLDTGEDVEFDIEEQIRELVDEFGGTYIGT